MKLTTKRKSVVIIQEKIMRILYMHLNIFLKTVIYNIEIKTRQCTNALEKIKGPVMGTKQPDYFVI